MATCTCKCSDCNAVFDINATLREKEEGTGDKFVCPKCKSRNIKQNFSVANFLKNVLKGDEKSGGCCGGGVKQDKKSCCGSQNDNGCCCG